MTELTAAFGLVTPYFNLVYGAIALWLLQKLLSFKKRKDVYIEPWKYLRFSLVAFMVEETLVIFYTLGIELVPRITFGFLEIVMITSFIYMLMLQKQYIVRKYHG